jgi:hypothetical protein
LATSPSSHNEFEAFFTPDKPSTKSARKLPPPPSILRNIPGYSQAVLDLLSKKVSKGDLCGIIRFDSSDKDICGGRVEGASSGICLKPPHKCTARAHKTKKAWKILDGLKAMSSAYIILYSWAALMAAHVSPLLQASIGDACPIIQCYKSFQLGMESWLALALFKMSLENYHQKGDNHKVPVEEANDFLATNKILFNDTSSW